MHRSRDLDFALHVVEAFVRRRYALSSLIPASVRFNFRFVEQDYAMRNDSQQNPLTNLQLLQIYSTVYKFTAPPSAPSSSQSVPIPGSRVPNRRTMAHKLQINETRVKR